MSEMVKAASTQLVISDDQDFFNEPQQAALVQMGLGGAPAGDIQVFFHYAKKTGLDPFSRQLYMINRGGKYTIQTSIDGFRVIRDRKGTFRGMEQAWCGEDGVWHDVWLHAVPPVAAKVTLYIDGFVKPISAVARFAEYCQMGKTGRPIGMWGKMPALMIAKVAEALALRMAYPTDFSGLYSAEEMAQADNTPVQQQAPMQAPPAQEPPAPVDPQPQAQAEPQPAAEEVVEAEIVAEPNPEAVELARAADTVHSINELRGVWEIAGKKGLLGADCGQGLLSEYLVRAKERFNAA